MFSYKSIIVFFFLSILLIYSCDEAVNVKKINSDPRLVVNAVFSENESWKIHISSTSDPFSNDTIQLIQNAVVKIRNESRNEIRLLPENPGSFSLPDSYPSIGKTYTLLIDSTDFPPIEATSSIPEYPDIEIDSAYTIDSLGSDTTRWVDFHIDLDLADTTPEKNYYLITLDLEFNYNAHMIKVWFSTDTKPVLNSVENNYYVNYDGDFYNNQILFTDDYFSAAHQSIHLYSSLLINKYFEIQGAVIHVSALSEEYYHYLVSLEQRKEGGSGPFSEPARIYSNIKNGYGIFAGCQKRTYYVIFEKK